MNNYISEFNKYLETEKKCSDTTLKAYTADVEEFLSFINSLGKSAVTANNENVQSFFAKLKDDQRSASTINRKLASLRGYYKYLIELGKVRKDPTTGIKSPRVERNDIEYLSVEEVFGLLELPDDSAKGKRDKALLELMYATGMRASEISAAKVNDLNLNIGFISVVTESGKARIIPIGKPAKAAISDYINNGARKELLGGHEDDGTLFFNFLGESLTRQGIWKILKFYGAKAGLEEKIGPQILRNSFAAHMIINGADLKSIQELLGHEDIAATKLFLKLSKNRIMDVYDRTHPRAK